MRRATALCVPRVMLAARSKPGVENTLCYSAHISAARNAVNEVVFGWIERLARVWIKLT